MAADIPRGPDGAVPYAVFSRHSSDPAVRQVGEVRATSDADAVVYAYTLYDERKWKDLFIIPQSAVTQLIEPE